jgi:hypothetical protein
MVWNGRGGVDLAGDRRIGSSYAGHGDYQDVPEENLRICLSFFRKRRDVVVIGMLLEKVADRH